MEPRRMAERLTVYLSQTEHTGRTPDYVAIVEAARRAGLAGATVIQGAAGFGSSARIHRRRPFALAEEVPVAVTIIDSTANIEAFLESAGPLLDGSRVVRQPTEVVLERPRRFDTGSAAR